MKLSLLKIKYFLSIEFESKTWSPFFCSLRWRMDNNLATDWPIHILKSPGPLIDELYEVRKSRSMDILRLKNCDRVGRVIAKPMLSGKENESDGLFVNHFMPARYIYLLFCARLLRCLSEGGLVLHLLTFNNSGWYPQILRNRIVWSSQILDRDSVIESANKSSLNLFFYLKLGEIGSFEQLRWDWESRFSYCCSLFNIYIF